ncbi:hypothetical protein BDK92_2424 [Micromonospora pisi]|uniref:Uncharacterized protein n=1 Tax=Micromonospora pisi TaxID=589240 RepID=A0A495JGT5_9ACTN|nr:hypothetical protein [Micromonospora pisi]RKR88117.1 hypothetical protein BDK92_2424 [Micromonospora pisi]
MSLIQDLTVEAKFYAAMHQLAREAWRRNLTVDAMLALTILVDVPDESEPAPEPPCTT